jgi:hypothetical protein
VSVESLSYTIDDQDRLIRLDDAFYRFAEENGWHEAGASLGRSLWKFVAGEDVRRVERLLIRRVRDQLREIRLPFRCDGPDVRREMEIRIRADSSGRIVEFSGTLLGEERREPQPLLDPSAPRDEETLQMCAWCDRFQVDGEWLEVEEAARRLELFRRSSLPRLDHRVCPQCSRALLAA